MKGSILYNIKVDNTAAEGNCIIKYEGKVIFVKYAVPGDVLDIRIIAKKKGIFEAKIERIVSPGPSRIEAKCEHFGLCGGCKWQHMPYDEQLKMKNQQVIDALQRIAKIEFPEPIPILGSEKVWEYRNRLDYAFSNKRWLMDGENNGEPLNLNGLGFHIPGRFDKVLDLNQCHLQDDISNKIRQFVKKFSLEHNYSFHDLKNKGGFLRNIIVRNSTLNEWMIIMVFGENNEEEIKLFLDSLLKEFPIITSLFYTINTKLNDTIYDLELVNYYGNDFMLEQLGDLKFKIRPKSFFQTNSYQAFALYQTALDFANLQGTENVYDFYCGTGTITNFIAKKAKMAIGVEQIQQAIDDAKENSELNNINNTRFYVGDLKDVFTEEFVNKNGSPDVIFTDPPRAGMHDKVIKQINESGAKKVVYISCNPATQARDLALMDEFYKVVKVRPVDMFPHTHHVENVVLLEKR